MKKKKKIVKLVSVLSVSILLACNAQVPNQNQPLVGGFQFMVQTNGQQSFSIKAIPESTQKIEVLISGDGMEKPRRDMIDLSGSSTTTYKAERLPIGKKIVKVSAYDATKALTSASKEIVIKAGEVTKEEIELNNILQNLEVVFEQSNPIDLPLALNVVVSGEGILENNDIKQSFSVKKGENKFTLKDVPSGSKKVSIQMSVSGKSINLFTENINLSPDNSELKINLIQKVQSELANLANLDNITDSIKDFIDNLSKPKPVEEKPESVEEVPGKEDIDNIADVFEEPEQPTLTLEDEDNRPLRILQTTLNTSEGLIPLKRNEVTTLSGESLALGLASLVRVTGDGEPEFRWRLSDIDNPDVTNRWEGSVRQKGEKRFVGVNIFKSNEQKMRPGRYKLLAVLLMNGEEFTREYQVEILGDGTVPSDNREETKPSENINETKPSDRNDETAPSDGTTVDPPDGTDGTAPPDGTTVDPPAGTDGTAPPDGTTVDPPDGTDGNVPPDGTTVDPPDGTDGTAPPDGPPPPDAPPPSDGGNT